MLKYICHRPFKGQTLSGYREIPLGYPLFERGGVIYDQESLPVCRVHSENGARHFCRDDDGQGLERGRLTFQTAYAERHNAGYPGRFSPEECKLLLTKFSHWLRPHRDVILFNDEFFAAPVEELRELNRSLLS